MVADDQGRRRQTGGLIAAVKSPDRVHCQAPKDDAFA